MGNVAKACKGGEITHPRAAGEGQLPRQAANTAKAGNSTGRTWDTTKKKTKKRGRVQARKKNPQRAWYAKMLTNPWEWSKRKARRGVYPYREGGCKQKPATLGRLGMRVNNLGKKGFTL